MAEKQEKITPDKDLRSIADQAEVDHLEENDIATGRKRGQGSHIYRHEAKQHFINRVHWNTEKLFNAQLDLAVGEKILMVRKQERNKDGKVVKTYHEPITDPKLIAQYLDNQIDDPTVEKNDLDDDELFYYMTTKPANNQAIQALLDRAYGKAPEKVEIGGGFFRANDVNINIVDPAHKDILEGEVVDDEKQ